MPLKGGMVASTAFIFLLYWVPCSSFTMPSSEKTEETLYLALAAGSTQVLHTSVPGADWGNYISRDRHKLGSKCYVFLDNGNWEFSFLPFIHAHFLYHSMLGRAFRLGYLCTWWWPLSIWNEISWPPSPPRFCAWPFAVVCYYGFMQW